MPIRFGFFLDEGLGLVHQEMGYEPIVPIITRLFTRFLEAAFGSLQALSERSTGIVGLLELMLRHRQHHVGLHLAGRGPFFGQSFLLPLHRAGETPLAKLSEAFY